MAEAAALVEEVYEPDFLDINFGCPVKKVVSRNGGSGCLRDLDLVQSIIRAVRGAISIPTTVKIRSGWSEEQRNPVEIALRCQDAGARRSRCTPAPARRCTAATRTGTRSRPGEGGAGDPGDRQRRRVDGGGRRRMREHTGCDGIMIARGSHGAPWIFGQARAALEGRPVPADPEPAERFRIVIEHARLAIAWESDEEKAMIEFRKHLGWYTKGLPNGRLLRQELFAVTRLESLPEGIWRGYAPGNLRWARAQGRQSLAYLPPK
jgi:tRNA-dihydrouridine synthase B